MNADELTTEEKMIIEKTDRFYRIAFTCKPYPNEKEIQEMTDIIEWFKVKELSKEYDDDDNLDGMTRQMKRVMFQINTRKNIFEKNKSQN